MELQKGSGVYLGTRRSNEEQVSPVVQGTELARWQRLNFEDEIRLTGGDCDIRQILRYSNLTNLIV